MPRLRTRIGAGCILYNESGDEQESVNRECRDMSGVIRPLLEEAEVSDEGGDCRRRVTELALRGRTRLQRLKSHVHTSISL